jgi:hypothetical protein
MIAGQGTEAGQDHEVGNSRKKVEAEIGSRWL